MYFFLFDQQLVNGKVQFSDMPLMKYDLARIIVSIASLNTAGTSRGRL